MPFSTSTAPAALTTIFTPPTACWDRIFTYPDGLYPGDKTLDNRYKFAAWDDDIDSRSLTTLSCVPSEYRPTAEVFSSMWFSPGVCPEGYTTFGTHEISEVTTAYCCPSEFTLTDPIGLTWWSPDPLDVDCRSPLTPPVEVLAANFTDFAELVNYFTTTLDISVAVAGAITVMWHESDLPNFTPESAPVLGLATSTPISLDPSSLHQEITPTTAEQTYFPGDTFVPWTEPAVSNKEHMTTTSEARSLVTSSMSRHKTIEILVMSIGMGIMLSI